MVEWQLLQFGLDCLGNIFAHGAVDIGQGVAIDVEDESIASLLANFSGSQLHFQLDGGQCFLLGFLQKLLCFLLKSHVFFDEILQFGLALLQNGGREVLLSVEKVFVFLVEFILYPLHLGIVFGPQIIEILLC